MELEDFTIQSSNGFLVFSPIFLINCKRCCVLALEYFRQGLLKVLFVLKSGKSSFIPNPHFTFLKIKQEITSRKSLAENQIFSSHSEERNFF